MRKRREAGQDDLLKNGNLSSRPPADARSFTKEEEDQHFLLRDKRSEIPVAYSSPGADDVPCFKVFVRRSRERYLSVRK